MPLIRWRSAGRRTVRSSLSNTTSNRGQMRTARRSASSALRIGCGEASPTCGVCTTRTGVVAASRSVIRFESRVLAFCRCTWSGGRGESPPRRRDFSLELATKINLHVADERGVVRVCRARGRLGILAVAVSVSHPVSSSALAFRLENSVRAPRSRPAVPLATEALSRSTARSRRRRQSGLRYRPPRCRPAGRSRWPRTSWADPRCTRTPPPGSAADTQPQPTICGEALPRPPGLLLPGPTCPMSWNSPPPVCLARVWAVGRSPATHRSGSRQLWLTENYRSSAEWVAKALEAGRRHSGCRPRRLRYRRRHRPQGDRGEAEDLAPLLLAELEARAA